MGVTTHPPTDPLLPLERTHHQSDLPGELFSEVALVDPDRHLARIFESSQVFSELVHVPLFVEKQGFNRCFMRKSRPIVFVLTPKNGLKKVL
jgi:hypothetical protein